MVPSALPSDQHLTLSSRALPAPDDLSRNQAVYCRMDRSRGPWGKYSFHLLEQKCLLGLPAPVSHFSPPLDGASPHSLGTRPPPCSGSKANFITLLFIAFARELGGLKSGEADTDLQQTPPPNKSTQLCHHSALPLRAPPKLAIVSEWELRKTPFRYFAAHRQGNDSCQPGTWLSADEGFTSIWHCSFC